MSATEDLAQRLAEMSPLELAELLESRELPYAAHEYGPAGIRTLRELAEHVLGDSSAARALADLNTPETQLLVAAATLAQRLHGPTSARADADRRIMFGSPGSGRAGALVDQSGGGEFDPARRSVPRAGLLDFVAPHGAARQKAEATLARLAEAFLALPGRSEDPDGTITVPGLLHRQATRLAGFGRPVDQLLSQAFQAAEIERVHRGLGLPASQRTRDARQRAVVSLLSRPDEVRALAAQAPTEARDLLEKLVDGPPLLRTHCFQSRFGGYYTSDVGPFAFRPEGSGDPGTDWLAERGMVVPIGQDLVELPYEVGSALRDPEARPAYRPEPPHPQDAATWAAAETVRREAQAAAAGAASRVESLLRAVDAQPLAVRKTGGVAVRETRRAAKQAGMSEQQARFWLDLSATAGLLTVHAPEPVAAPRGRGRRPAAPTVPPVLVPTSRYDDWLAGPPAERLLPLIAAWATVPEVFTWWPDSEDSVPVALVTPENPLAVPLRRALLETLAGLPDDHGVAVDTRRAVEWLIEAAAWHRPAILTHEDELGASLSATLAEAHLLGVAAHGALTPIGHAALALLRAGAARYYPAIPGTGPSLDDHPHLAEAIAALQGELSALLPTPTTTARFQADLTAVVAGAPSAELTDLLGSCADRESEGHAVVWRLSAASVRRALDAGHAADDLLSRLSEASEGGLDLPQPLTYLIKDTARTHGRIRVVRSACCIRSDDEHLILELSKTRTLAKIGLRRIAPTVLISTADPETTLAALRGAGYAPTLEAETGDTVIQRVARDRAPLPPLHLADAFRGPGRNGTTAPALAEALLRKRP